MLNLAKSQEIIFIEQRRKTKYPVPDAISLLQWVQTIRFLGVTWRPIWKKSKLNYKQK